MAASYTATAVVPVPAPKPQPLQPFPQPSKSTPQRFSQNAASSTRQPAVPSPGRFQHPRMAEIMKRRSANDFTLSNIRTVVLNVAMLVLTFAASGWLYSGLLLFEDVTGLYGVKTIDSSWVMNVVRLIFCSNIYFALRPVLPYVSKPDNIEDIPLTPSQRALLGLPRSQSTTPASASASGQAESYITPPRYRRSSPSPFLGTPQSDATNKANYSASPLSTSRYTVGFSPTPQQASGTPSRRLSGSPFSPSSPLFNKAFLNSTPKNEVVPNADFTESTRSLLAGTTSTNAFQSSLRRSQSVRERGRQPQEPGTPSPSGREKSRINIQPGVNYKWIYDKGLKMGKNGAVEYDR